MRRFPSGIVFACLLVSVAPSYADVFSFTDFTPWSEAVAPEAAVHFLEDFQGFAADAPFRTSPVAGSFFTLVQNGTGDFRNYIDVLPFGDTEHNGTSHASMFTDDGFTTVEMSFTTPVFAWGADFFDTGENEGLDLDLFLADGEKLATLQVPLNASGLGLTQTFFGFAITGPVQSIDKIIFRSHQYNSNGGEGFGMDNVRGAGSAVVPVPGAALLGLLGLGHVSMRLRRRIA